MLLYVHAESDVMRVQGDKNMNEKPSEFKTLEQFLRSLYIKLPTIYKNEIFQSKKLLS